ncbi:MAG TPA: glycosyltransferase family 1 protein [Candidatus Aquilonibacter sp.]|nr:glycosyltransferase family 1 protein [Candidatus Aquilonibacter sp.]
MKPLSLAVDARVVAQDTRGIGRYERAILRRLAGRPDVQLTLLLPELLPFLRKRALADALESPDFRLARRADARRDDLIWHPANGTFFTPVVPSVVTMHDAVPFRFPPEDARARASAQEPFLLSARTATAFITPSEFGKREIVDVFDIDPERVHVIYHGVEPTFTPGPADALPAAVAPPYILFVGDPLGERRKNFSILYDAHRAAWPDADGPAIVVAGSRNPHLERVVYAGEVGDDLTTRENVVLRALYRGALALAVPSYHETFGMPLIEAMACGTPVVASDASCLPEIGADAALYAQPDDPREWAAALRQVADDESLRRRLSVAGIERARRFTWERSVDEHLALFSRLVRA